MLGRLNKHPMKSCSGWLAVMANLHICTHEPLCLQRNTFLVTTPPPRVNNWLDPSHRDRPKSGTPQVKKSCCLSKCSKCTGPISLAPDSTCTMCTWKGKHESIHQKLDGKTLHCGGHHSARPDTEGTLKGTYGVAVCCCPYAIRKILHASDPAAITALCMCQCLQRTSYACSLSRHVRKTRKP